MQAHPFIIEHNIDHPVAFAGRIKDFFHQAACFLLVNVRIGEIFRAVFLKLYVSAFFFRQGRENDRFCFAQEINRQIMGDTFDPGPEFIRVLQLI